MCNPSKLFLKMFVNQWIDWPPSHLVFQPWLFQLSHFLDTF